MLDHLTRQFLYNGWANLESAESLRSLRDRPGKALRYLAHIVAAEWLWLERLQSAKQRMAVWPELNVEQCCKELEELSAAWREYLSRLSTDAMEREISYVNSKGEAWSNSVRDILTHVLLHSASHRGQLAAAMRAAGHAPAYTDYIHWARNRLAGSI